MQATPHTPADTEIENLIRPKSGRWIATLGVALFTGPVWGMLGTVIGMIRAFNTLAEDEASSTEAIS